MRGWLVKKVHISWHIAAWCGGCLTGAVWARQIVISGNWPAGIAIGLCGLVCWRRSRWLLGMALVAGGLVGLWRGALEYTAEQRYKLYYGSFVQLNGVLRDDVAYDLHGQPRFELFGVQVDQQHMSGHIWASITQRADIKRGDRVSIEGKLSPGFGNMPASLYRARLTGIERPHPGDIARVFRDWFARAIRRAIPEPQASLGIGYLTGQRSSLPPTLDEQLRIVGLTHAVVASGYNLTILVGFARSRLVKVSKYLATICSGLMVLLFMMVTGFSPSMSRAGLVSGLSLLTWYYGRTIHPVVLLLFVAALTVLIRPGYVWGDIGWCLSFAAFAGVILVAPLIHRYFYDDEHKPPALIVLIIETVSAELVTLPIILSAFGQLAVYALPANLLVLPLVPLAMLLTFGAGLAGLLIPGMAHLVGWPATALLRYMTWVVEYIAQLPGAQRELHFSTLHVVFSYAVLGLLCVYLWQKTGFDFRGHKTIKKV